MHNLHKYLVVIPIILFLGMHIIIAEESTDDLVKDVTGDISGLFSLWQSINTLDQSSDLFYDLGISRFHINKSYLTHLPERSRISLHQPVLKDFALKQNINTMPYFPYVLALFGGYNSNDAILTGFLFKADFIKAKPLRITSALSFGTRDAIRGYFAFDYSGFFDSERLTLKVSTGAYTSSVTFLLQENILAFPAFNIYGKFRDVHSTGFDVTGGVDFLIPKVDINITSLIEFSYDYLHSEINEDGTIRGLYDNNFGIALIEDIIVDRLKHSATLPRGLYAKLHMRLDIPTQVGSLNKSIKFKSLISCEYNYAFYKEFLLRVRGILAMQYGVSTDFAGEPYIRGLVSQEMTGWFGLMTTAEILLPLVNVDLYSFFNVKFKKVAKFLLYWAFFVDTGFAIDTYSFPLDLKPRRNRESIENSFTVTDPLGQVALGKGHYMMPAVSVGTGIRIHPFFLHFMIRVDVSCNILKAAVYKSADRSFNLTVSFTDFF